MENFFHKIFDRWRLRPAYRPDSGPPFIVTG
jgi:hypothetical protein